MCWGQDSSEDVNVVENQKLWKTGRLVYSKAWNTVLCRRFKGSFIWKTGKQFNFEDWNTVLFKRLKGGFIWKMGRQFYSEDLKAVLFGRLEGSLILKTEIQFYSKDLKVVLSWSCVTSPQFPVTVKLIYYVGNFLVQYTRSGLTRTLINAHRNVTG